MNQLKASQEEMARNNDSIKQIKATQIQMAREGQTLNERLNASHEQPARVIANASEPKVMPEEPKMSSAKSPTYHCRVRGSRPMSPTCKGRLQIRLGRKPKSRNRPGHGQCANVDELFAPRDVMTRAPAALSSSCTIGASRQRLTAGVHRPRSSGALDLEKHWRALGFDILPPFGWCRSRPSRSICQPKSARAGSHLLQARNTRRQLFS